MNILRTFRRSALVVLAALFTTGAMAQELSPKASADVVPPAVVATKSALPTLRVHAPSVVIRQGTPREQRTPDASATAHLAGQIAYVDANGNLTSTPPPGTTAPTLAAPRPGSPTRYTVPSAPDAAFYDTRHIRSVMRAELSEKGQIVTLCERHTDFDASGTCAHLHEEHGTEKRQDINEGEEH